MSIRRLVARSLVALAVGVGCSISLVPGSGGIPLDEANATFTINQQTIGSEATVVAKFATKRGWPVELADGQAVAVNEQALTGPDPLGEYSLTINAAPQYTIRVNEPTRGVAETTVTTPAAFDINSPAPGAVVSLSGFTLAWSNADPSLQVRITLTQTLFATERTQTFGPFTDTGSASLDHTDLRQFQQGANLMITVTKIRERLGVNGLNSATVLSELWQSVAATPGP